MKQTHWVILEHNRTKTNELAKALDVPPIVAHIMGTRGIETVEQGLEFLHPTKGTLSDPFLLTDMKKAVERIELARDRNEHIMVFGDYDVDGISGTVLLVKILRRFGISKCSYNVPSRFDNGYGLSQEVIDEAHEKGVNLIITVDNGVSAWDAGERAKELGVDLIITDHHQIECDLPNAVAIVNPKREPEDHPAKNLCGAAVAFKLACALTGTEQELDLVALGTVADIVPLLGENRVLAARGLQYAKRYPRAGLRKLAQVSGLNNGDITSEDIAFGLAPRMNAVGRLDSAMSALELLLTDSDDEAIKLATRLNWANEERRKIELKIVNEIEEELKENFTSSQRSIVISRKGWNPGVIGIVAARIYNRYNRPVILISIDDNGEGRGSGRCSGEFDLVGAMSVCQDLLVRFGGHKAAAGMTILENRIDEFKDFFEAEAANRLPADEPVHIVNIDSLVALSELDAHLLNTLEYLQPFGHFNSSPMFCSKGVIPIQSSIRILKERHLRFSIKQGAKVMNAIAFNMSEYAENITMSDKIDIAFTPKFNTWRGETTIQLIIKDIHTHSTS